MESNSPETFDYLLYPEQHPNTFNYIQNQFQNIGSTIMESGRKFVEDSKKLVEQFYDSSVERAARAAVRMAKNIVNPNAINRYDSLEELQSAPPLMQRYIMAEPYIRDKYHHQLCSGFAGNYIDMDPSFLRHEHYDFRRVENGVIRFEGDNEQWISTTYFEDLREGDKELTWDQKIDIRHNQRIAKMFALAGEDPTSPWGEKIG